MQLLIRFYWLTLPGFEPWTLASEGQSHRKNGFESNSCHMIFNVSDQGGNFYMGLKWAIDLNRVSISTLRGTVPPPLWAGGLGTKGGGGGGGGGNDA